MHPSSLLRFWNQLHTINRFTRSSQSLAPIDKGWNLKGHGTVRLSSPSRTLLVFYEKGVWEGRGIQFSNTYRWTLDENNQRISLEHLRFGPCQPVFLLHLVLEKNNLLQAAEPHRCDKDLYCATLPWSPDSICLNWNVTGPEKNETIRCCYTTDYFLNF